MSATIRNPIEWGAEQLKAAGTHLSAVGDEIDGSGTTVETGIVLRRLSIGDLRWALVKGVEDFKACRSDVAFLCLVYPAAGLCLTLLALRADLLPMVFPLVSGFTLLGPVAAVGLYDLSRRRERGELTDWTRCFRLIRAPSFGAIFALGLGLLAIFATWLFAAQWVYGATLGPEPPARISGFVADLLFTGAGWAMAVLGVGIGFVFAALVLATTVITAPLILDRHVGLVAAVAASLRLTRENPREIATWGAIVAAGLVLGSLPFLLGLIYVMPVLGHATWHLYRRAVAVPGQAG